MQYRPLDYMRLQLALYSGQSLPASTDVSPEPQVRAELAVIVETPSPPCACLLCDKVLATRSSLTRHTLALHHKKKAFAVPFRCPRCHLLVLAGPGAWCAHVEKAHAVDAVAPNILTSSIGAHLKTHLETTETLQTGCPICLVGGKIVLCVDEGEWAQHAQQHISINLPWTLRRLTGTRRAAAALSRPAKRRRA
jgi:uncharacterized C2H2 Zn-finger protein